MLVLRVVGFSMVPVLEVRYLVVSRVMFSGSSSLFRYKLFPILVLLVLMYSL